MVTQISVKSGKGTSDGVVSELTTFFTVLPGHEQEMSAALERWGRYLHELGPDIHRKIGLREWRQALFDDGRRMMLSTAFETDWDPYVDDALTVFGLDRFSDWLRHTVEAEAQGKELKAALEAMYRGEGSTGALAGLKALLQSAQVPANIYLDVLSDQTVPQIRKAQRVEQGFQRVLDDPAAAEALQHPALKPLLDEAVD
jgi:hypothetical protein